jgi:hypothetical protein
MIGQTKFKSKLLVGGVVVATLAGLTHLNSLEGAFVMDDGMQ